MRAALAQSVERRLMFHLRETVDVTYLRDGKKHTTTLKPKYDETTKR